MLYSQTVEKLRALRLEGMLQALEEQRQQKDIVDLDFEARLALWWNGNGSGEKIAVSRFAWPLRNSKSARRRWKIWTTGPREASSELRSSNCARRNGLRNIGIV